MVSEMSLKALINGKEELLKIRGSDAWGSGAFGASRDNGKRKHKGVDFLCAPETKILSPVKGKVIKLGYPYEDNLAYRYIRIKTPDNYSVDLFYVDPWVNLGDEVVVGQVVGVSQSLQDRYKGIPDHVHLQITSLYGTFINPTGYFEEGR